MSCDWPNCIATTEISKLLVPGKMENFYVCESHYEDSVILDGSVIHLIKVVSSVSNDIFFETIWLHFLFNHEGFISKVSKLPHMNVSIGTIGTVSAEISKILNRKIKILEGPNNIGLLVGPSDPLLHGNLKSVLTIIFIKNKACRYTFGGGLEYITLVSHKFMINDMDCFEKEISQFIETMNEKYDDDTPTHNDINRKIDTIIYPPNHNDIVHLDPKNTVFGYMTFILDSIEISTDHYKGILPLRIENGEHLWNLFDETEYYEGIIEDTLSRLHTKIKSSQKE